MVVSVGLLQINKKMTKTMDIKSAKLANFCWAQGVFTPDAWQINDMKKRSRNCRYMAYITVLVKRMVRVLDSVR